MKKYSRIVSLILVLGMLLCFAPLQAAAAGNDVVHVVPGVSQLYELEPCGRIVRGLVKQCHKRAVDIFLGRALHRHICYFHLPDGCLVGMPPLPGWAALGM